MLSFLRVLAAALLLGAAIAGVYDATRWLAGTGSVSTSLLDHWKNLAPSLLASAQTGVQRFAHPLVWDGIAKLLALPAWAVLGGLGVLVGYAGRRRRRINVFAN
jgi:hypothetical protein